MELIFQSTFKISLLSIFQKNNINENAIKKTFLFSNFLIMLFKTEQYYFYGKKQILAPLSRFPGTGRDQYNERDLCISLGYYDLHCDSSIYCDTAVIVITILILVVYPSFPASLEAPTKTEKMKYS